MNKSIILLSGGLDSLVSLGLAKEEYNIQFAITFDYGQKALKKEVEASNKICRYYNIEHVVLSLPFLKEITKTALVSDTEIPDSDCITDFSKSANAVWVPNRNGLFLNVAGSFADAKGFSHIIIGANKEEAQTFSDNTQKFIDAVNNEFEYSTQIKCKVLAPLINYDKNDIVKVALENNIPLELTMSCYSDVEGHCGHCESCMRLKHALEYNQDSFYKKALFKHD